MFFHEKYNLLKENDSSVLTLNTVGGFSWNINICKLFKHALTKHLVNVAQAINDLQNLQVRKYGYAIMISHLADSQA